nr:RNA-dependent RNA polymerase [ssRNA positive-strand virus sp.]
MSNLADYPFRAVADQLRFNSSLEFTESADVIKREAARRLFSDEKIGELLINAKLDEVKEDLNTMSKLREVFVYQKLSKDDQDKLRKSFCMFNLNFTRAHDCSGHPFWRAHRLLSEQKMLSLAGINKYSKPANGYDCVYKDVGGNPTTHLNRRSVYVHTCAPLLSHNDDKRHSAYKEAIRRWNKDRNNNVFKLHVEGNARVICHKKSQCCSIKAEVLIFLHSTYDMTPLDIANSMSSASALTAYGCFHFSPVVLYQSCGEISNGMWFSKYMRSGRLRIRFFYKNDNQEGYDHDWVTYVALIRSFRIKADNGDVYNVQFDTTENDTVYFVIRKSINGDIPPSRPYRVFTNEMLENKLIVYYWRWETVAESDRPRLPTMVPLRLIVPRRLYNKMIAFADTLPESKFTVKNILVAATSFNTREVISGQNVGTVDPIDPITLKHLAHAIYLMVYISNYECSKALSLILADEDDVRKMSRKGFFRRLFSNRRPSPYDPVKEDKIFDLDKVVDPETSVFRKVIDKILSLARVDRYYKTVVRENLVQFLTLEQELDAYISDSVEHLCGFTSDNPLCDQIDCDLVKGIAAIDLPTENLSEYYSVSVMRSSDCDDNLRLVDNDVVDDCIYTSILHSNKFTGTVASLKSRLSKSRYLSCFRDSDSLEKMIKSDERPDANVLLLASLELSFDLCLHIEGGCLRYGSDKYLHFQIKDGHCQYLAPSYDNDSIVYDLIEGLNDECTPYEDNYYDQIKKTKHVEKAIQSLEFSHQVGLYGYTSYDAHKVFEIFNFLNLKPVGCCLIGDSTGASEMLYSLGIDQLHLSRTNYQFVHGYKHKFFDISDTDESEMCDIRDSVRKKYPAGVPVVISTFDYISCGNMRKPVNQLKNHLNAHLLSCALLEEGGAYIFRTYKLHEYYPLIIRLFNCFSSIKVLKLRTSSIVHTEMFVVCENYKFRSELLTRDMQLLTDPQRYNAVSRVFNSILDITEGNRNSVSKLEGLYRKNKSKIEVKPYGTVSHFQSVLPSIVSRAVVGESTVVISSGALVFRGAVHCRKLRDYDYSIRITNPTHTTVDVCKDINQNIDDSISIISESSSFVSASDCSRDAIIDAMSECVELTKCTLDSQISNHSRVLDKLSRLPVASQLITAENGNYVLCQYTASRVKVICGEFLGVESYNKFFFGSKFYKTTDMSSILSDGDNFLFSAYCEIAIDEELLDCYTNARLEGFHLPSDCGLVQAAPGCGKTTYIVNNFKVKDMTVLLSTREGRADFLDRVMRKYSLDESDKKFIRTVASYLVNYKSIVSTNVLYIDEALMSHPGQLFFAIYYCRPKVVRFLGDVLQIPFVNRTPAITAKFTELSKFIPTLETLYVSYRCPLDVAYRLNPYYLAFNESHGFDKGMMSVRLNLSSSTVVKLSNELFPKDKTVQYLTFTQSEKQKLMKMDLKVSTVHEFQGKEAPVIYVVRLNPYPNDEIFLRFNYALVALTRHSEKLVYYTRVSSDALSKLIGVDGIIKKTIAPEDDLKKSLYTSAGSIVFDIPHYDFSSELTTVNVTSTRFDRLAGHKMVFVPRIGYKECYSKPFVMHAPVVQITSGVFKMYYVVSSELHTQRHNLNTIRMSLQYLNDIIDRDMRIYVSGTFEADLGRCSVGYLLHKHVRAKFTVATTDANYDIPNEVSEFAIVNGINSLQNCTYESVETVESAEIPSVNIEYPFSVAMCQDFVNSFFGDVAIVDQRFDSWDVVNTDISVELGDVSVSNLFGTQPSKHFDCMRPVLYTPKPHLRNVNKREVLLAMEKRNRNVPFMNGVVDFNAISTRMVDNLIREAFDEEKFRYYTAEPIRISTYSINEWLVRQPPAVKNMIVPEFAVHQSAVNSYLFSIKRAAKPNLTIDAASSYLALQTIVYHEKPINAYFCSVFRELKFRLLRVLRKNVKIFTDMSAEEFEKLLDRDIPSSTVLEFLEKLEIDISKYDKSQRELALEFECKIMLAFGVSPDVVELWYNAHILTEVYDRCSRLKAFIAYQRKSGDASTFVGNTLFLMAVICDLIPVSLLVMALFSGDDSLLIGMNLRRYHDVQHFALKFNLEIKFLNFHYSYFCSKFLLVVNGRWRFVCDPLKLCVKLGRSDLVNPAHVEEYRVSVSDHVKRFNDIPLCIAVSNALQERYTIARDHTYFLLSLPQAVHPDVFCQLFYSLPEDVLDTSITYSRNFD